MKLWIPHVDTTCPSDFGVFLILSVFTGISQSLENKDLPNNPS
jgi:hypothetical protein